MPFSNGLPADILCARDYERLAPEYLPAAHLAYIAGGSGEEASLQANQAAFNATALLPRLLQTFSHGHTRLPLLGRTLSHPVLLAPVAYQRLAHEEGELATARGAAAADAGLVVSTLASQSLESIAQAAGEARWFQLYWQVRRSDTLDLVRRAEAAGYQVLVLTLDSTVQTPSRRAQRAGFVLPPHVRAVNLLQPAPALSELRPEQSRIFQGAMAGAPTWDDLVWLLNTTRLPILIKGVLHPDDALRFKERGVAGLIVSNHGGRSLDGVPASLTMLPHVRQAVGAGYPVLLDSGIRSGADIFKALALGADAVLVGRLQVYALAVAGALGVAHLIRLLREELEVCMAQAGCATLADIRPDRVFQ